MLKIMLICNEGMSTGFLCNKMNEVAKAKGIGAKVWAVSEAGLEAHYQEADVIMTGPQIAFLVPSIKERVQNVVPVEAINPIDFGRINAEAVLNRAIELAEQN